MDSLPLKVYSYPRSGTHLMMALLHANFDFGHDLALRVVVENQSFDGKEDAIVPWGRLFGFHEPNRGDVDFTKVVYVLRNPIARAYSWWQFLGGCIPFEQYVTEELFASWRDHAQSFGVQDEDVFVARYEDFRRPGPAAAAVLAKIQERWNLTRLHETYRHVERPVGWTPREGQAEYEYHPAAIETAYNALGPHCLGYEIKRVPG